MTRTEQGDVYEKCQQRLTQGGTRRFRECLRSFTHSSRLSFIHSCTHLFNRRGRLWYPRFSSRHPIRPRHCRAPLTHVTLPHPSSCQTQSLLDTCREVQTVKYRSGAVRLDRECRVISGSPRQGREEARAEPWGPLVFRGWEGDRTPQRRQRKGARDARGNPRGHGGFPQRVLPELSEGGH